MWLWHVQDKIAACCPIGTPLNTWPMSYQLLACVMVCGLGQALRRLARLRLKADVELDCTPLPRPTTAPAAQKLFVVRPLPSLIRNDHLQAMPPGQDRLCVFLAVASFVVELRVERCRNRRVL